MNHIGSGVYQGVALYLTSITRMCILSLPRWFNDLMLPVEESSHFHDMPMIRGISSDLPGSPMPAPPPCLMSAFHHDAAFPELMAPGEAAHGTRDWHCGQIVNGSREKGCYCFVGVTGDSRYQRTQHQNHGLSLICAARGSRRSPSFPAGSR